jgi:hypothetical protein
VSNLAQWPRERVADINRGGPNMKMIAAEAWGLARWNLAVYVAACIATFVAAGPVMPMIG